MVIDPRNIEVMDDDILTFEAHVPAAEALEAISDTAPDNVAARRQMLYPIVGDADRLLGVVTRTQLETAVRISRNAPIAVRQAKLAIHAGLQTELATGLTLEVAAYNRVLASGDRQEGIAAFHERREPRFRGE